MSIRQNRKLPPFSVGQRVHHLHVDRIARTVLWVSKGATCREDQVIVTDATPGVTVEADIYVEAA